MGEWQCSEDALVVWAGAGMAVGRYGGTLGNLQAFPCALPDSSPPAPPLTRYHIRYTFYAKSARLAVRIGLQKAALCRDIRCLDSNRLQRRMRL